MLDMFFTIHQSVKSGRALRAGVTVIAALALGLQTASAAVSEWTWVSGSDTVPQSGVYGTLNTPNPANHPGGRAGAVTWFDSAGHYWLFGGGLGYDRLGASGYLNDLWEWDGTAWTWRGGSDLVNDPGDYGIINTPNANNQPGGRGAAASWVDSSGDLWLFGGYGVDSAGDTGNLNDLWRWDGTNWTWISGSDTIDQAGVYGTQGDPDPGNHPGARGAPATWIDSSDHLWLYGGYYAPTFPDFDEKSLGDLWEWNGAEWAWISGSTGFDGTAVYGTQGDPDSANHPNARLSGAHWRDSLGNFWLFGGSHIDTMGDSVYWNDVWKWDGAEWTWVSGPNVPDQDGEYGTQGDPDPGNLPGARTLGASWVDDQGTMWMFGGAGYDDTNANRTLSDLWIWDGADWTWVGGPVTGNQSGEYGSQGTSDTDNNPGGRRIPGAAVDADGDLWLFGGIGYDGSGANDFLNDLWKYESPSGPPGGSTLSASLACNGGNLDVTISGGDGPFDVSGAGPGLPTSGVSTGTTNLATTFPGVWVGVTVSETGGDLESMSLGSLSCGLGSQLPPKLKKPKNGSAVLTHTPKLIWQKGKKGTTAYHVQIDNNSDFSSPSQADFDVTKPPYTTGFLGFGVYSWRVSSKNATGWSAYSTPFTFEVTLLKSPKKGKTIKTHTPKFVWGKVPNVSQYTIELSSALDCSGATSFTTDKPFYKVMKTSPLASGPHYWRVSPDNGATWTGCWGFTIQ